jgi:PAS domain S-box-containing protein
MTHTRESRKIAAAIVGLGNSLSLTTVAEGVEDQAIADMLLWLGCDIGQGWLYGRPVPPEQLPETLAARMTPEPPSSSPEPRPATTDSNLPLRLEALPTQRLAQLNAIYDGVPVGLCYLDRNLRFVSVNKRLAEMHNLPVASHLGRHIAEVIPEKFAQCELYLLRALDGISHTGLEISYPDPHRPAITRTILVSFQPARDEVDEVVGVSISVVDISRRKQAEQALIESEDHYRNAVELSPEVPWTADPNGMILDTSLRWEALTGLTKQESLGTGWVRVLHPDDRLPALRAWEKALRTGELLDIQYRIRCRDSEWRWMRVRAAPRRNEDGKIIRWYGTLEDIDDHKKAEEALRRSEARLQAIFEAAPIGIVIADAPDCNVVMSNPRADDILRNTVAPITLIDDYCRELRANASGHIRGQQQVKPLADAIMSGKSIGPREELHYNDDGTSTWISLTAAPVIGLDGKLSGGVVAIPDLDDEKRERQRLAELADVLKNKLATHR